MDSTSAAVAGDPNGGMSEIGRLVGVFWEPKKTFTDLAKRPRWIVPLVLSIFVSLILVYSFSQQVGWETFLEQQLANNSRIQSLPAEQRDQIIEQQSGIAGVTGYVGSVVGGVAGLFIVSGVLLLLFKIVGAGDLKYKNAMAAVSYGWLPFVVYNLLALVVLYANPRDFNLTSPLPFSVGWFLEPSETGAWVVSLGNALNLFSFWSMALIALGCSAASRALSFGKAFGVILGGWLLMTLIGAGWAALFG